MTTRAFLFMSLFLASLAAGLYSCSTTHVSHAHYDGTVWSCPADKDMWVDEGEALSGKKDFVYCVPKTKSEIQGIEPEPQSRSNPIVMFSERLDRT